MADTPKLPQGLSSRFPPAIQTSTTTMPPPTTRSFKQRRVSLPGTNPLQSISARLDQAGGVDPSSATFASTQSGTTMGPPSWGAGFRDDSSIPSSANAAGKRSDAHGASSPTVASSTDFASSAAGPSGIHKSTFSVAPQNANTNGDAQPLAVTRRRRAATVTAKAKASGGRDFVAPLDPVQAPQVPPINVSSASTSVSPPSATPTPTESSSNGGPPAAKPRKPRKRWTMEETQALVDGCNKWGVGNWKAILNDSQFQFQGRSPVDLKDRFRTYFPDAYRHHYPNAKTHLSSRVRSFLPDGTSIFEKTRSKKRRPFSAEEDEALRLGYEKHGTTWATIVKDPVFASQERRSTDLRDRFRNAFPDLYKAAGYKPRPRANTSSHSRTASSSTAVSKAPSETSTTRKPRRGRASTVATSTNAPTPSSSSGPSVSDRSPSTRRRRTNSTAVNEKPLGPNEPTAIDFYRPRGGHATPSAVSTPKPEDIPIASDTDESSSEYEYEEEEQYFPLTAAVLDQSNASSVSTSPAKTDLQFAMASGRHDIKDEEDMDVDGDDIFHDEDGLDGTQLLDHGDANSHRSPPSSTLSPTSPLAPRSIQDLLDSAAAAIAGNGSTSRGAADFSDSVFGNRPHMMSSASSTSVASADDWTSLSSQSGLGTAHVPNGPATWLSNPSSPTPSDFFAPPPHHPHGGGRIGKSAWGPQDWLSNNPRLDTNMGLFGGNGALTSWPTPASDQHAVLDRYDLYSTVEAAHDYASEADVRHPHNPSSHQDESIFRGFTHHRYAGDLIPGSGVAVHPTHLHTTGPLSFGALGLGLGSFTGLSLTGGLHDDYSGTVSSSAISLANLNGLQDIDELSVVNHISASGAASPLKRPKEQELDLDAMIVVEPDQTSLDNQAHTREQVTPEQRMSLHITSALSTMPTTEDVGAITPTGLKNTSTLPGPTSPIRMDQPRLSSDFNSHRRTFVSPPARPHSRSVNHGQMPPPFRPTTPSSWREASRSISQPPSEHRQALQRSLSYLDPMTSHGAAGGILGSTLSDDPLAYSEPASISSLDLQYGMSSGPNIFTPLTMFSDAPSINPMRTLNSNNTSRNSSSLLPQQPPNGEPDALDLSALIHTSPVPPSRNHQRHQSQSVAANPREGDRRKRSSWDGGLFGIMPSHTHSPDDPASVFLDFTRNV